MGYMRSVGGVPLEECRANEKVKFIFCFTIAPKMQKMGVATQLLQYVCQDAAADGFSFIEAFTHEKFDDKSNDAFRGPMALYKKCGFEVIAENEGKVVLRKAL